MSKWMFISVENRSEAAKCQKQDCWDKCCKNIQAVMVNVHCSETCKIIKGLAKNGISEGG